jgi:hypothetical protein
MFLFPGIQQLYQLVPVKTTGAQYLRNMNILHPRQPLILNAGHNGRSYIINYRLIHSIKIDAKMMVIFSGTAG